MLRKWIKKWKARRLYRNLDYIDAYREHTDLRVQKDPHRAVGGYWDEMGDLQFSFLKSQGLLPHHKLLDIGCGALRGGRHFIRYLAPGNYTGTDLSPRVLEFARTLIEAEGLREKEPTLILNETGELSFSKIGGRFDFLLAQSVFTHLPAMYLEEAFANVHKVMNPDATFFFTIFESGIRGKTGRKTFRYPLSMVEGLVESNGFELRVLADLYPHPTGQIMLSISKSSRERQSPS